MQPACIFNNLETQEWQNIDNIFLHRNAEEFAQKFAGKRQKILNSEKIYILSARDTSKFGKRRTQNQFLKRGRVGNFVETGISEISREILLYVVCYRSLSFL